MIDVLFSPRSLPTLALLCFGFCLGCAFAAGTFVGLLVFALGDSLPVVFGVTPLADPSVVPDSARLAVIFLDPDRWGVRLPLLCGSLVGFATFVAAGFGLAGLYVSGVLTWILSSVLARWCASRPDSVTAS